MSAVTVIPYSRPLTQADLLEMPDDGHRYELIDGILLVSPAPRPLHQRIVVRLSHALDDAAPPDLEVLVAPLDVILTDDTSWSRTSWWRRSDLTDRGVIGPPVLAIEVLSPSTRRFDLLLKPSRLAAAGVPSYWTVDPDGPTLTAWRLEDGEYVLIGSVTADEPLSLNEPFPLTVVPAALTAERG